MNRGKISFGKIGLSLGAKPTVEPQEEPQVEQPGFGSFGKIRRNDKDDKDENKDEMSNTMGFSGFGKKARDFDVDKLVEETCKSAVERNRENIEKMKLLSELAPSSEGKGKSAKEEPPSETASRHSARESDNDDNEDFIGPPLPPEPDEESEDEEDKLPISHELVLEHGNKAVSGLAVDPSGTRLVSGGLDYDVKYWDFQGMDQSKEAFRSFCPADGYPVNVVEYSCTGDKVLVVAGSSQAKVYDRDGIELSECVRGDMYLHDMAKTKGHIAGLTCGTWHPKDKEEFLTSGRDGTCRLWHAGRPESQKNVIKARASNGLKTVPTTCSFNRDGSLVACACDDGSIQMWDHRKNFVNVTISVKDAHERGSDTSGLSFSYDNRSFITRGGDDTIKLWDVRNAKRPVHVAGGLFNRFGTTNCTFSPNDQMVVTGTSLKKGELSSKVVMFDRSSFEMVREINIGPSHVVRIIWHPRLNQIMLGCGDGKIRLLYEPKASRNGAVLVASKLKKRSKQAEVVVSQQIITPHALPMFREERHKSTRKLEERDRKDPVKSRQPDLPVGKAGSGGRVSAGGSTLSSYIIRNMGLRNKVREEGDPREALLKYARAAEEDPYWVTPAYVRNQPKTIFLEGKDVKEEEEEEESEEPVTKKIKSE